MLINLSVPGDFVCKSLFLKRAQNTAVKSSKLLSIIACVLFDVSQDQSDAEVCAPAC